MGDKLIVLRSFIIRNYSAFLLFGLFMFVLFEATRKGDFYIFLLASQLMQEGGDIYTATFVSGFHYFYSPFFALILIPFTHLPHYITNLIWLTANIVFVFQIYKLIPHYLDISAFSLQQKRIFWIIGSLLVYRFFYFNFHLLQMTIFLLYALMQGTHFIRNNKDLKGAALLSLAINIKIIPIVILPWLLYRGYFKAFMLTIASLIFLLFLPALLIDWDYLVLLNSSWWNLINPLQMDHLIDIRESGFHSLTTFFAVFLLENARNDYDLNIVRNIASLEVETVIWIINFSRILLVVATLWFLQTIPFKKVHSPIQHFWELSYILAITPLIFPHQQFYAFLFLLPAFFYLTYVMVLQNMDKKLLICLIVVFILCAFIGGILGFLRDISRHFKLITFGALITIVLLAIYRPGKIKNSTNGNSQSLQS